MLKIIQKRKTIPQNKTCDCRFTRITSSLILFLHGSTRTLEREGLGVEIQEQEEERCEVSNHCVTEHAPHATWK